MHKAADNQVMLSNYPSELQSLPVELQLMIMNYLSIGDLATVGRINHHFNKLSNTPSLWRNQLQLHLQIKPDDIPNYMLDSINSRKEFYFQQLVRLINTENGELAYKIRIAIRKKSKFIHIEDMGLINFTLRQWQALGEILRNFSRVKIINFIGIKMTNILPSKQLYFCQLLSNSKLTGIDLSNLKLGVLNSAKWFRFCEALTNAKMLRDLRLNNNQLERLQAPQWHYFGEFLKTSNIEILCLEGNNFFKLNNVQLRDVLSALSNARMLRSLNMCLNEFNRHYYSQRNSTFYKMFACFLMPSYQITTELKVKFSLQELYLARNNIGNNGIGYLAPYLKTNKSLRLIDFGDNFITVEGANTLVTYLKYNTSIKSINFSYNKIADSGASAFADLLLFNSVIEKIDLRNNKIGDKGAYALYIALISNFSVKTVDLLFNNISKAIERNIHYLLSRNKIIELYPRYINLILAVFAKKNLYKVTYTPLALRILCAIAVMNKKNQENTDKKLFKQQLNEDINLLINELGLMSNWFMKELHDGSLPHYGCDIFFAPADPKKINIDYHIKSLSTIWHKGIVRYLLLRKPDNIQNKLEKQMYQLFQIIKEFLEKESFKPIPSDSIYCIKLTSKKQGLDKLKKLINKYAFASGKVPQIPFFITEHQTNKLFNLFYLRGDLIRLSLASLCRYIIKKSLYDDIQSGEFDFDFQKIDSYLLDSKNPEAKLIKMIDNKIQSFHSEQLNNISIANFDLTSSNKNLFMQKLCGYGMKIVRWSNEVIYYTSPSMSQNHMKTFISALEDAFSAINFDFDDSSKLRVPGAKSKNYYIAYKVNSQVNPNYVRVYISEWLVNQLVAMQNEKLSVFAIYPPSTDFNDDDSDFEYSL